MAQSAISCNRTGVMPRCGQPALLAIAAMCVLAASAAPVWGQIPTAQLSFVFPTGAKQGTSVEVQIGGGDLDDADRLIFSHPGITSSQKMTEPTELEPTARPVPNTFLLQVAGDVPVGTYEVRAVGRFGASNPRLFVVGSDDEMAEPSGNNQPDKAAELPLGTIVNGRADASGVDYFRLDLVAGQTVLVECWARRLDSKMVPALVLWDSAGHELRRVRDRTGLDARLDFQAPSAGTYVLGVHDFVYAGGGEYFYRLAVHTKPRVEFVFPPSGLPGASASYTVYGYNLPGSQPAEGISIDGTTLQKATVELALPGGDVGQHWAMGSPAFPCTALLDTAELRVPGADPVQVYFARAAVVVEQEPNNESSAAQQVSVPCEYVGQLYPQRDEDWVQFEAKQGDVFQIEVICQRMGIYADPYLAVQQVTRNDNGEETVKNLANVDDPGERNNRIIQGDFDTSTDDPSYRLEVGADGVYRVMVRDQFGSTTADPRCVYRLVISRPEPDFRLAAVSQPISPANNNNQTAQGGLVLRRGSTTMMDVIVERRDGFDGEIEVSVDGLPEGVACRSALIGGNIDSAPLVFVAAENAAAWSGPIRVVGKATIEGKEVVRQARGGTIAWGTNNRQQAPPQFRAAHDVVLSVMDKETGPAVVEVGDGHVWETSRGGTLDIPIKVTRYGEFKNDLNLQPRNVPNELKPGNVNVGGGASEGKLEFKATNGNAKAGTYTFVLQADTQMQHQRNPDALAAAEAEQKRLEGLIGELTENLKKLNEAKEQATRAAQEAANATKAAQQAKQNAEAAAKQAADAAAQAAKQAADAKAAAANEPGNQGLADAATNAEKAATDAEAAKKAADEKLVEADKALVAANEAEAKANEAKAAADKIAAEADAKVKAAQQLKQAADKNVNDTKNANNPKNLNVSVVSTPITIRVVESPLKVTVQQPQAAVKQGEKTQVPVTIERLYGFADQVEVTLKPPQGVSGLGAAKLTIPGDQTQGTIEVNVDKGATVGQHVVGVEAKLRFNNVNIDTNSQVTITVDAAQ